MKFSTVTIAAFLVGTASSAFAPYPNTASSSSSLLLLSATAADGGGGDDDDKVTVRFVNYNRSGETVKKQVSKGMNVLNVADDAGVQIPRNCRSGLCGSCTADMVDPSWQVGDRPGFQTIRLCASGAVTPEGCDEMVIDCWRQISNSPEMDENGLPVESSKVSVPMERFGDNWENDFTPDFKSGGSGLRAVTASVENKPVKEGQTRKIRRKRRRDAKDWNCRDLTDRVGRVQIGETEGVAGWLITEPTNWGI